MKQPDKSILDYVGDDGEFLYPIADIERIAKGEGQPVTPSYQSGTTVNDNNKFSLEIENQWIVAYVVLQLVMLLCVCGLIIDRIELPKLKPSSNQSNYTTSDVNWLSLRSEEVLNLVNAYNNRDCVGTLKRDSEMIPYYRVTSEKIAVMGYLFPKDTPTVLLSKPNYGSGWYQLNMYQTRGYGIILDSYFLVVNCKQL